jgi:hypothetical protein
LILVLVVGGVLGWYVRKAHQQAAAVAAIRKAGGGVFYDVEWNLASPGPYRHSWSPMQLFDGEFRKRSWLRWLVERVGIDYFGNVVSVDLNRGRTQDPSQLNDALMVHMASLPGLRLLRLNNSVVTDAGLAHLRGLTNLQDLELLNTRITDAGLVHLEGLSDLRQLNLVNTKVTDAGLEHLKGPGYPANRLGLLLVDGTRVTDCGLAALQRTLPLLRIYRDSFIEPAHLRELDLDCP